MQDIAGENLGQEVSIRKVAIASAVGTMVEWYDYFIFGTAAAVVFNQLFFPNVDPLIGTLAAFATFGVGFVARPVGAVVFGHFGDRIGRKAMLVLTLMIMGVATFIIGLLPTYEAIGIWAPIALVVMRLLQGFGVGGEWGGAALMIVEYAPEGRRGFWGAFPQMGNAVGLILSTSIFALFALLPEDQFLAWGWRVPFLLSIALLGVGLYIRARIAETPAFRRVQEERTESRLPIVDAIRTYPKNILLVMGMRAGEGVFSYIIFTFVLAYATEELGFQRTPVLLATTVAAAFAFFTYLAFGTLSDRIGRRLVYIGGSVFLILFSFPFVWLVGSGSLALLWLAVVAGYAIAIGSTYGVQPAFFSELFGTRVRYTGVSIGAQFASIFTSGIAPTVATALAIWSGGALWPIALYIAAAALVTLVCAYLATETFQSDISAGDAAAPEGAKEYVTEEKR